MKSIKLALDGNEKVFTIPFVNGLAYRKYVEAESKIKDRTQLTNEEIDSLIDVVVLTFDNQFSREEYLAGTAFDKVIYNIQSVFISSTDSDEEEDNEKK